MSQDQINQLYQKYYNRQAGPEELNNITTGVWNQGSQNDLFDTPEKLEGLLQRTSKANSVKAQTTIDENINELKSGKNLFGGKLPDFSSYLGQNKEYTDAQGELDTANEGYDQTSQKAEAAPSKTNDLLQAGSSYFGDTYSDIAKRYSDQDSAWYISDPELRQGVIDNASKSKKAATESVISKIKDIYSVLTTASANQLAAKSEKVQNLMTVVGKSYEALMSYYGQEMADEAASKAADVAHGRDKEMAGIQHGYNMSEIGAQNNGNLGDTLKLQSNPLLAMENAGYKRQLAPDGGQGYWFYDSEGNSVDVDVVANAIGGNKAGLLEGSSNPDDQQYIMRTSGKPPTANQQETALYATRIQQANDVFGRLEEYTDNMSPVSYYSQAKSPQFLNFLKTNDFQSLDQAQRNFVNAVLRRESGAAIADSEFENAKLQYFPQPGDGEEALAQKKQNRETVLNGFIQGSGTAYGSNQSYSTTPQEPQTITTPDGLSWTIMPDGSYESQ